jgi:nicotinate-nucleotide pyrophosphorylase (carboxylating)
LKITRDLRERIRKALAEDIGPGDATTQAVMERPTRGRAVIIAREKGVVCGLPVIEEVFRLADKRLKTKRLHREGDTVSSGNEVFEVRGDLAAILTAERVALNFLQHLSGVASVTRRYVEALKRSGTQVLDTRKTTPLWRDLEKYAVRVGGGVNHRFGLYDMILIKNNHADAAGGLGEAIRRVKRVLRGKRIPLLVMAEARNVAEVRAAVAERVDIILLDNFTRASLRRAMREIPPTILTEASGGMTLRRVRALADLGLNRISVGALTHSAAALDFALRYRKP